MPHAIPQTHSSFYPHRLIIEEFIGQAKTVTAKTVKRQNAVDLGNVYAAPQTAQTYCLGA